MKRRRVRATESFAHNLDDIERFLEEADAPSGAFGDLLEAISETVMPNLARFPDMGTDLLARRPQSVEARLRIAELAERLGAQDRLREYITGDYLLLYLVRGAEVILLAIRHHRQLSWDLRGHWVP